ncbi:MAG: DUF4838 domain-containing protein, partial [Clostridia bacterium]|nr:DUF4838 domain-containing protein [Clostridia bacterium]
SASVEWAYQNDIVTGRGNGIFDPFAPVSREEASLIFYKYAALKGLDLTDGEKTFMYGRMKDITSVSGWATDSFRWAVTNGLMFNKGNNGNMPLASPKKPASRSDVAYFIFTMLSTLDGRTAPVKSLTIAGNDISLYKIVYSSAVNKSVKSAAKELQKLIRIMTGKELETVTDSEEPTGYEIILGKTNREDKGLVTVERSGELQGFTVTVQGTRLVIAGTDDYKSQLEGTLNGVIGLAEEALGFRFFTEDIYTLIPSESVDLPDGYSFSDGPGIPNDRRGYSTNLWVGGDYYRFGDIYKTMYMEHNMGEVITGRSNYDLNDATPCLTDPENLKNAVAFIKKDLDRRKAKGETIEAFCLSQNDSKTRCQCENCLALVRRDSSRSAPIIYFCNKVLEALEPDYPDVKILTLAYEYSVAPPRVTKPNPRIIVKYCTIDDCASHPYTDENCVLNGEVRKNLKGWSEILNELYVWDYCDDFSYTASLFPMFDVLRQNYNYYHDLGVKGIFINGTDTVNCEFETVRSYLIARLTWDPGMTEEVYDCYFNTYMLNYYGQGYKELREFLDLVEALSGDHCFGFHTEPYNVVKDADVVAYKDKFNELFDAAEAGAESPEQLERVTLSRLCLYYMIQNATYKLYMVNGSAAQKQEYMRINEYLHQMYVRYKIKFSENDSVPDSVDYTTAPCNWK